MDDRAPHPAPEGTAGQPSALGEYQLSPHFVRRTAADVYDATHTPTGGARRVYVLRPAAMQNHALVHQVVCEADAARWMRQPAAAKLETHGDTPSRRLYVAVERPAGRPLGDLVADAGYLAPRRVVRLAGRLVEALDEAHLLGLVHGRLTPSAAIVAPDADGAEPGNAPAVTLTGFGTGALEAGDPVTDADRPFVSPEQLAGAEPDARSDVFGLASLLEYALCGAPPAEPTSDAQSDAQADVAAVHQVLAAARSVDPRRRPATIKAFWEDLLEALVADAVRATGDVGAAAAHPAAPLDERAALAHLELADFAISPPAPTLVEALPAAEPPRASALEFRGVDVSAARRQAVPARRAMQPRWAEPRAVTYAPAPAEATPARAGRTGRGVRTALVNAWWLAVVPAVAAAFVWPVGRGAAHAPAAQAATPAAAVSSAWQRITAPPVLETVTATPQTPAPTPARQTSAGTPAHRDADASGVADEPRTAAPAAPHIDMPQIYIVDAPVPAAAAPAAKPLVRTEEFNTRIKIPGAP